MPGTQVFTNTVKKKKMEGMTTAEIKEKGGSPKMAEE